MHMRTGKDIQSWGKRKYAERSRGTDLAGDSLREYAAVIPPQVRCFPEYLRAAAYFCTNNSKTDYQFAAPLSAWDENDAKAHWRHRAENQPFFSVFNFNSTHESMLWKHENLPLTVDPQSVPVPPYLPDDSISRRTIARHYSNVELMDQEVGEILQQLKEDGLYDETIIFFYSDHGGPLPRQKREIYDSGLRIPFLVKMPRGEKKGRTSRMISLVDLGPTLLSLAGIQPPAYMEGKAFLGAFQAPARSYVFGSSDRFDEQSDRIRVLRDARFLYVRNFIPELPKYRDLGYRKQIPMMQQILLLKEADQLSPEQQIWFGNKEKEELYDCEKDPHNLHNLADDPAFRDILRRFQQAFYTHLSTHPDLGFVPEVEMIDMMWPGGKQPVTATPEIIQVGDSVQLRCTTEGASIVYLILDQGEAKFSFDAGWKLYQKTLFLPKGKYLYAVSERIGYKMSKIAVLEQK